MTIEYEQRAGVLRIHTANTYTLHAEPLNSFHCKEVTEYTGPGEAAPGMEEAHKYFEDKVIRVMGEETNLKNGTPTLNMYSDCTHMYIPCWPDWGKIVGDTYGGWGMHQSGQICCLRTQTAKSAVKSGSSKHYLPRR